MANDNGARADDAVRHVLGFWFGELDSEGLAAPATSARWFQKSDAFDAEVRERFEPTYDAIVQSGGPLPGDSPHATLATIIVLDQLSRNMFLGTPKMFSADPIALRLAKRAIDAGALDALRGHEQTFLIMPLMHSEALADQRRCEQLFSELAESSSERLKSTFSNNVSFAKRHREIIERFGRFPHRNATLGRESTPDELAFLEQPGSSF